LWSTDWSLTVLLVFLLGNIFIVPLGEFATWGRLAARGILSLIIISGVIATIRDLRLILLATALALGSLLVGWEDVERPNLYFHLLNDLDALLFIGFFVVLILRQVLRAGPINSRRVQGSAIYLLLGILWAVSYDVVELLQPGSFSIRAQCLQRLKTDPVYRRKTEPPGLVVSQWLSEIVIVWSFPPRALGVARQRVPCA
jgi:hypothetical protein